MEIYILRDGTQIGPFSEETTQRLLKQGSVLLTDMAWRQDMTQWIPLQNVLYPVAENTGAPPPPPPPESATTPEVPADPSTAAVAPAGDRATAKQKAFLSYVGVTFAENIGKEEAALLMHDAMENPKDPARLARWNDDRLRLHPELFAAEIQAKKDSRAQKFFDLAHSMGEDCFDGLTKAHCQVLVGYLDVKFPNWDVKETEAAWNYFFPAVAEKFPDVVRKEWRDRLKYPSGPKVGSGLKGRRPSQKITNKQGLSPFFALCKGLVIGILTLIVIVGGIWASRNQELVLVLLHKAKASTQAAVAKAAPNAAPASPAPAPEPASPPAIAANDPEGSAPAPADPAMAQPPLDPATSTPPPPVTPSEATPPATSPAPEMTAPAASPGESPAPATAASATPAPPKAAPSSLDSLFGPPAGSTPAAPMAAGAPEPAATPTAPVAAASPAPAVAAHAKTTVTLTRPVEVTVAFGKAKLPAGTQLKFVSQEGPYVKVNYLNSVIAIPASSTDVGANAQ